MTSSDSTSSKTVKTLELFAGTARLSSALRAHGCNVTVHERYGERVEWDAERLPQATTLLYEHDVLEIDPERLPLFDYIHASPECCTYSSLAYSVHNRHADNGYLGVTPEAHVANRVLNKLVRILESQLARNPALLFTIENPWNPLSGMHKLVEQHEQLASQIERPRAEGGLGGTRCTVTYCMFDKKIDVKKPTLIWTNCNRLARTFYDGQYCCGGTNLCQHKRQYGKHPGTIRGTNDSVKTAAFPHAVANHIASHVSESIKSHAAVQGSAARSGVQTNALDDDDPINPASLRGFDPSGPLARAPSPDTTGTALSIASVAPVNNDGIIMSAMRDVLAAMEGAVQSMKHKVASIEALEAEFIEPLD